MSIVRWPPVLRGRHQLLDVLFDGIEVQLLEFLRVIEIFSEWVSSRRVLVKDLQIELIGPPVFVGVHAVRCIGVGVIGGVVAS